jgi:hypothetical protein
VAAAARPDIETNVRREMGALMGDEECKVMSCGS